ncbi:MAG: hypothetical protein K8I29_01715 [Alphaproteobacteria bacterium]|uniref:Uncharacterized protein n=1 Tax=Candidatus Nitrobium versatile TaxID=2884831 RepID=A0A953J285_9BACT|nr:hypothetical protein [Candidatus Nitrobium versatile]
MARPEETEERRKGYLSEAGALCTLEEGKRGEGKEILKKKGFFALNNKLSQARNNG